MIHILMLNGVKSHLTFNIITFKITYICSGAVIPKIPNPFLKT